MRIRDALYFAPDIKFADLASADTVGLVEAFRARVSGFYLSPASRLLDANDLFAAGLICCAAVEFIATVPAIGILPNGSKTM